MKNGHTVSQSKYVTCRMIHDSKIDEDGISMDDTFYVPARPDVSVFVSTVGSFRSLHLFKNLFKNLFKLI